MSDAATSPISTPASPRPSRQWLAVGVLGWLLLLAVAALWMASSRKEGGFSLFRLQPQYEARVVFRLRHTEGAILKPEQEPEIGDPDLATTQRIQSSMIRSRLVLNAAVKDHKVVGLSMIANEENPAAWLEERLQVDFATAPELMRVRLAGNDKDEIEKILEAVARAYMDEVVFKEHTLRLQRIEVLQEVAGKYSDRANQKRRVLRELVERVGEIDPKNPTIHQQMLQEFRSLVLKDFVRVKRDYRMKEVELQSLLKGQEKPVEQPIPRELIERMIEKDPVVLRRRDRLAQVMIEIDDLKRKAKPGQEAKLVETYFKELEDLEKALEARKKAIEPDIIKQVREQLLSENKSTIEELKAKLTTLNEFEKALKEDADRLDREINQDRRRLDLESPKFELASDEAIWKRAMAAVHELEVNRNAPPRITLLEEVVVRKLK